MPRNRLLNPRSARAPIRRRDVMLLGVRSAIFRSTLVLRVKPVLFVFAMRICQETGRAISSTPSTTAPAWAFIGVKTVLCARRLSRP